MIIEIELCYRIRGRVDNQGKDESKMQTIIKVPTNRREELIDITSEVERVVSEAKVQYGLVNIYVRGATAAIMIQENWDQSVQTDVLNFLRRIIPGEYGNMTGRTETAAHLKSGLIGPSETVPIINFAGTFHLAKYLFM